MKREQKYQENLVSVIMPAHNAADTLAASMDSVLSQTYPEWELLVIDDASTDETRDIAEKYAEKDKRIRYMHQEQNQGVATARNCGIDAARGRYLAFLDSDDLWMPEKLEKQVAFMQSSGIAFSYHWYSQFIDDPIYPKRLIKTKKKVDYEELLQGNDIGCLTVMLNREKLPEFQMKRQYHEDYICWLDLLKGGVIAYSLAENLALYRLSRGSLSGNKLKSCIGTWHVYRDSQKLGIGRSLYFMVLYIWGGQRNTGNQASLSHDVYAVCA